MWVNGWVKNLFVGCQCSVAFLECINKGEIHSSYTHCKSLVYTKGYSETSTVAICGIFFVTRKTIKYSKLDFLLSFLKVSEQYHH